MIWKNKGKLVWGRHRLASLAILGAAGQLGHSGFDARDTGFDSCENKLLVWGQVCGWKLLLTLFSTSISLVSAL